MPGTTPANTVCEAPALRGILDTCEQMLAERVPNLFRPFLNSHVARAVYCLTELCGEAWPSLPGDGWQAFLANSFDEALSGAIKLARHAVNAEGKSPRSLIIDEEGRLEHFASTDLPGLGQMIYLPEVKIEEDLSAIMQHLEENLQKPGTFVCSISTWNRLSDAWAGPIGRWMDSPERPFVVVIADSSGIAEQPASATGTVPDIVIFDEAFVDHAVPFAAFVAQKNLYEYWNRRGMATFHSTTYQPNTISTLHFVRCLRQRNPNFFERHRDSLTRLSREVDSRRKIYRERYSPSLAKLATTLRFDKGPVTADGHYIEVAGQRFFDGVAGVACSMRGHNPPKYASDVQRIAGGNECRQELSERLQSLTGLSHLTPAVSGASAVEHALKLALVAQYPKNHVLALRGGFGGKTLFALTGTWKPSLKTGLSPLYPNVIYVDPFARDAKQQLTTAFAEHPVAVVQVELVQGVGGVRAIPLEILQSIERLCREQSSLLLIDEVQTGMFRTGPFVRSTELGIQADLLTLGKGASDMMFPFGLSLHSNAVQDTLVARGCSLVEVLRGKYDYEVGMRTLLATLRRAEQEDVETRVRERGAQFKRLLEQLAGERGVAQAVRCFGLLIGLELNVETGMGRWLKKILPVATLLAMMRDSTFPVLGGFCQYEQHVLKLTPPLSISEAEVTRFCETVANATRRPWANVVAAAMYQSFRRK